MKQRQPESISRATRAGGRLWDCVVVGAGPAGAMAARELALRRQSVLIVDKSHFPRFKVCGGCLNPRTLRLLAAAGLGHLVRQLNAVPLDRVCLASRRQQAEIALPHGAAVSREAFDAALIDAAVAAGAEFLPGAAAQLQPCRPCEDRRRLRLKCEGDIVEVACRLVLAAHGLAGKLDEDAAEERAASQLVLSRSRIGAGVIAECPDAGYERSAVYMACGESGYVGLVRIEDGRLDVAAALDPAAVKAARGLGALADAIIDQAGFPPVAGLSQLPWKGTPHLTRQARQLAGERLLVLGDAAGYIEPFTGEGIAWALASARLAAPLAAQAIRNWHPSQGRRWRAIHKRRLRPRQTVCRLTAELLRRPRLTRGVIRLLSKMPWLSFPLFKIIYRD